VKKAKITETVPVKKTVPEMLNREFLNSNNTKLTNIAHIFYVIDQK
jgi:hypothetical protein